MEMHAQLGSPIETQIQALVQAQFPSRTETQTQDKAHANWAGFLLSDVLWALGVWSVILTLSPIVMLYVLMVN
jgi:Fe2+ transport system protein B